MLYIWSKWYLWRNHCVRCNDSATECSTYGVSGICGGIIASDASYYDVCDACTRVPTYQPTYEDCLTLSTTEEQLTCLKNKIEVLSQRCDANQEYQNSCESVRDDIRAMLRN